MITAADLLSNGHRRDKQDISTYCFTAPLVNPLINSLWSEKNNIAGGIIATSVPARKTPYCCTYVPMYWFNTTGSVNLLCDCRKIFGAKNAFQAPMKLIR